jgi:DnaJ-class molecular chaperone
MANDTSDDGDRTEEAHQPRECMPCRGSGKVISNLGDEPSTVECPWCKGGGVRLAGTDAQAGWLQDAGAEQPEQPEVD